MSKSSTKMSIFRIISIGLLTAILAFAMTGCRNVGPVTSAEFESAAGELGYSVTDITNDYAGAAYQIDKCIAFEVEGMHVEFFELGSADDALGLYNENQVIIENRNGSSSVESTVQNSSHSKYTLKTGDTYYIIEQVGATAIYAYCPIDDSSKLDDIIKAINY